ncbi:protein FAM151B isoform X2 [Oreochromis aureus]|uniref:protein FAM151B isoform X2 n=1 Tax=Oreochromis aureus TaxID=47969 RepID=UPI00195399C1|nr:protein FAM151B isoform X2 [Oreochromis aureus]
MKTNLLLSFHRIALILIGCFIFYVLWNLKGAMRDQTLDYFFSRSFITRMDAAEVSWSHAANSRSRLAEALTGPSLMIEADIVMRGRDPKEPIMAHPPDTDSDITLREWLEGVKEYGKGIKLDFKSMEAVSPSLVLLQEVLTEPYRPVWINADIFSGPGGQIGPLQRHTFLSVVTRLPSHTVLSLGWTTGWTAGTDNPAQKHRDKRISMPGCGRSRSNLSPQKDLNKITGSLAVLLNLTKQDQTWMGCCN